MSTHPKDVKGVQVLQTAAARALDDDEYRRQLLADPKGVLQEAGLDIADGLNVEIHENTADTVHLVLPARPQDWSELDLEVIDIELILQWPFRVAERSEQRLGGGATGAVALDLEQLERGTRFDARVLIAPAGRQDPGQSQARVALKLDEVGLVGVVDRAARPSLGVGILTGGERELGAHLVCDREVHHVLRRAQLLGELDRGPCAVHGA